LDSVRLREEIGARVRLALPVDCAALLTSDPELGLLSHGVYWDYPESALRHYYTEIYPEEGALRILDLARNGAVATTETGPLESDAMSAHGFGSKLLVTFSDRSMLWGAWCLVRGRDASGFSSEDEAFARVLAPHIAAGLRRAALLEVAQDAGRDGEPESSSIPAVAVYDAKGKLLLRDARVERYLGDLTDVACTAGREAPALPSVVAGALAHLRWHLALADASMSGPADGGIRVRGRSGQWYTVHASAAESVDGSQAGQAVVVISPMLGVARGGVMARLYGLTPREREVLARVAHGESSKQIATLLSLSAHTVQSHINNACSKVGARGRKELVAKLLFDSTTSRIAS
jgi:DNA-binding CsgD family transcriptional regulator